MSKENAPQKENSVEEFLAPGTYDALKEAVRDSLTHSAAGEEEKGSHDITPLLDDFEKAAKAAGVSEVRGEKLFWNMVVDVIPKRFQDISKIIRPDMWQDYKAARVTIRQELHRVIQETSPTLYKNLDRRNAAFIFLKERFYRMFPYIESLVEGSEVDKKEETKMPAGRLGKEEEVVPPRNPEGEFRKELRDPYLVEEPPWPVPQGRDLRSGLNITLEDRQDGTLHSLELVSMPRITPTGEFAAETRFDDGDVRQRFLKDYGLLADSETGLWYIYYKPIEWYHREEQETK